LKSNPPKSEENDDVHSTNLRIVTALRRPAFDSVVAAPLLAAGLQPLLDDSVIALSRQLPVEPDPGWDEALVSADLVHEVVDVEGPNGVLTLSVVRSRERTAAAPVLYTIHGGGMVLRNRFAGLLEFDQLGWAARFGMVLVTPEYGLAPEAPAPAGVEDCFAGLQWVASNSAELGIDPHRIIVGGISGGGGLAAGTALLARDRGGPDLLGQMLICPQLDDRNVSTSAEQFRHSDGGLVWPTENNEYAWDALLGKGHADRDVSQYSAPGRAMDLSNLPRAFLDVGDAEVFRDEVVAYASLLWASGVNAELHVWPGLFHGFDLVAPTAQIVAAARDVREKWLERVLA
jgi:acetyl esterase/lipase